MKEFKTIALNQWVTVREMAGGRILIFVPSDQSEAGHITPASEMYLSRKQIAKLAAEFPEEVSDD